IAQLHRALVIQPGHGVQTAQRWHRWSRTDVYDDEVGAVTLPADVNLVGGGKARVAHDESQPVARGAQPLGDAVAPALDDVVFALDDGGEVYLHLRGGDAEPGARTCHMRSAGAGNHRFGGGAAVIDTGTAECRTFDQDNAFPGRGQAGRKW